MPRHPAQKSRKLAIKRKRGFSWRIAKKNQAVKKKIKKSLIAVVLFLLSLSFLFGIVLFKSFTSSFTSASSDLAYSFSEDDLIVVCLVSVDSLHSDPLKTNSIKLILLDKNKSKVIYYEVPLETTINLPGRFGEEMYSNILSLGMLRRNNLMDGVNLLTLSLGTDYGIKIDRFLVVEETLSGVFNDFFTRGAVSQFLALDNIKIFPSSLKTDFGLNEFYEANKFIASLPADRFLGVQDLSDEAIRDITFDSKAAIEGASVAVLNGTSISGAANSVSRIIQNCGGRVIASANSKAEHDRSILVVDRDGLEVVKEIVQFFGIKDVIYKTQADYLKEDVIDRTDATLIIGFDIAEAL